MRWHCSTIICLHSECCHTVIHYNLRAFSPARHISVVPKKWSIHLTHSILNCLISPHRLSQINYYLFVFIPFEFIVIRLTRNLNWMNRFLKSDKIEFNWLLIARSRQQQNIGPLANDTVWVRCRGVQSFFGWLKCRKEAHRLSSHESQISRNHICSPWRDGSCVWPDWLN